VGDRSADDDDGNNDDCSGSGDEVEGRVVSREEDSKDGSGDRKDEPHPNVDRHKRRQVAEEWVSRGGRQWDGWRGR
jgi:hypothetical protein